jgi:hypothetical protein
VANIAAAPAAFAPADVICGAWYHIWLCLCDDTDGQVAHTPTHAGSVRGDGRAMCSRLPVRNSQLKGAAHAQDQSNVRGRRDRGGQETRRRARRTRSRGARVLVATLAVAVMLACGTRPHTTLSATPASALILSLEVNYPAFPAPPDFPIQGPNPPPTLLRVTASLYAVQLLDSGNLVVLNGPQALTCDGVEFPPAQIHSDTGARASANLPDLAPGTPHRCVYTDEHGHSTTALIPLGPDFAITYPTPGAKVPLPDLYHLTVVIRYAEPAPPGASGYVAGSAFEDTGSHSVEGTDQRPTGQYVLPDPSIPGQSFDEFGPGTGAVGLDWQSVTWSVAPQGFHGVQIIANGAWTTTNVTWTLAGTAARAPARQSLRAS